MGAMTRWILFVVLALFAGSAIAAAPVEGVYRANGKDARLTHAVALKSEPFSGKPTTKLIFSEKQAGSDAHADFHAQMGNFGDALVVTLMKDDDGWRVIGTEFAHAALKHSGASGTGIVEAKDVSVANGEISGHLLAAKDADLLGEPLVIDLHFHVKQP